MKTLKIICLLSLLNISLTAQNSSDWIFDDSVLPEVHITIEEDSLNSILDPENALSDYEYPADFEFKKGSEVESVSNIGFRIRGNTSRYSGKKSFKVSFNTFESGREYRGLDKMNLNGEHNDPSIIRSKLSWDFFREIGLPAPRANHVKLYINEEYFGLYINVEHIDDEFVTKRFGTDAGNLYKCLYPADLAYLGDQPSVYHDLQNSRGQVYELKTNEEINDYSDLAALISFFENADEEEFLKEVEDYVNVDGVLQWMAVDVLTGNWDNYWFNKNNFYLYHNPVSNRFEFIPYDYDNTFGIDWIGQNGNPPDWGTRDINSWGSESENRPLTERILRVEEYRNRFNYYVNTFLSRFFNTESLYSQIDRLKLMVEEAAENDSYRTTDYGYTVDDYHNSFTEALSGHVEYGLKPYINARYNAALEQLQLENITPIIRTVDAGLITVDETQYLSIEAEVVDEDKPVVTVKIDLLNSEITTVEMNDTGEEADEIANDGIYSVNYLIPNLNGEISLSVEAKDDQNKTGRYPNNPDKNVVIERQSAIGTILINEFMADNEITIPDEFGDYEDWIELYNPTDNDVSLLNYFLTDDFNDPLQWALPDTTIEPGGFLLVWADNDEEEGPLHTNFGLSNDGEEVGLYYQDETEIRIADTLSYGPLGDDLSIGRQTDGATQFVFFNPSTPGTTNNTATSNEQSVTITDTPQLNQNYPNPFNPITTFSFTLPKTSVVELTIYAVNGQLIQTLVAGKLTSGTHSFRFDASLLASGIYIYQLKAEDQMLSRKFTLIK